MMIKIHNKWLDASSCFAACRRLSLCWYKCFTKLIKSKSSVCCVRQFRVPTGATLGQLTGRAFIFLCCYCSKISRSWWFKFSDVLTQEYKACQSWEFLIML